MKVLECYEFLKHYKSADDKQQLMIRLRIGQVYGGSKNILETVDVKVLDKNQNKLQLTKSEFLRRGKDHDLSIHIIKMKKAATGAAAKLIEKRLKRNSKSIFNLMYQQFDELKSNKDTGKYIQTEETKRFYDSPVRVEVWEKFLNESRVASETDEPALLEELEEIATGVEGEFYEMKRKEKVSKLSYDERYKQGEFDKNNIFECFGFCWSTNPDNGDPYIADSYRSLILRLADYRFNNNPPLSVKDFDDEWVRLFLKYLSKEGYSSYHPKHYTPFNLEEHRVKLINSDRKPYAVASFQKNIKHLKRYMTILQEHDLIRYYKSIDEISAKTYISRTVNQDNYTRRNHNLTSEEFTQLCQTDFEDDTLNLARDMFIIAVYGGGLRGEEFYNDNVKLELNDGIFTIVTFQSKTYTFVENPVFGVLQEVIDRHDGKLPEFLGKDKLRKSLGLIAQKLNFDRVIWSPNTYLGAKKPTTKLYLVKIFSIYFARKTFVSILEDGDMNDEEIILFTEHSDRKMLKHYKARLSLRNKVKMLEKAKLM